MSLFADRIWETTTTSGTGTVTLAGAQWRYRTLVAGVGNGKAVLYSIIHRTLEQWEVGLGVVTDATADTLSRLTVLASSNSGSLVNFSAGLKDVIVGWPAQLSADAVRGVPRVKVATTANITLSNTQTIDGVAVVAGDAVLVKNQSTASQNGIYIVASGAWTRRYDSYAGDSLSGQLVMVDQGTVGADTLWACSSNSGSDVAGTNSLAYAQIAGAGVWQPLDATLTALAALTIASGKVIYGTGTDAFALADSTSYGRSLWNVADEAALKTLINIAADYSRPIYQSITPVGTVDTGEDDLISQTVAADTLGANGDRIRFTWSVTFAANGDNKTLKVYWNGVAVYDSGALALNAGGCAVEMIVTRTEAATQNILVKVVSGNTTLPSSSVITTGSATLSSTVVAKLTGEATTTDDIVAVDMLCEFLPAP